MDFFLLSLTFQKHLALYVNRLPQSVQVNICLRVCGLLNKSLHFLKEVLVLSGEYFWSYSDRQQDDHNN